MNIKILTDSTCDLPKPILDACGIDLTPLTVVKDGAEFKDGITITPAEIFAHVAAGGALCSTSAVSVGEYQDIFAAYTEKYDGILQICIGSGFSASYQNACLAAQDYENVRVIDSQNLTVGQGFLALNAYELAKQADSLDALAAQVQDLAGKVETSFVVDKLDYLAKGGRCSSVAALGANLLSLKPCIELIGNKLTVGKKYRGNLAKCLTAYIRDRLADRDDIDTSCVFLVKTVVPEESYQAVKDAIQTYGHFEQVQEATAGCTISCHCGPGTLGIIFLRK